MECKPGAVEAFEWVGLSWAHRWLTELGATPAALAAVRRLAAADDLRTVNLAEEAPRCGLTYSFLLHALLVRGDCVDLTPFEHGVPLGQLATIPVYCSDARCRSDGKVHGPGCQHHKQLHSDDDRLTLGEWIGRPSPEGEVPSWCEPCVCDRCGGFAIRRLDGAQLGYWRAVHEVYQAATAIEACEQHLTGACEPDRAPEQCDRALQAFTRLGVHLERHQTQPALAEYVKDLRVRHETLARRADLKLP